ncbi:TPR-like protein [Gloeophyllum trabeum ATCC 11539]|uniref:TPR-like protein n=1 Tax=Gloeophyllum trabeum (strain ATCC 11539 / FP-39264 / Madison 617) TaxID=670483 RepID=S7Q7Y5_GLOTA|nr:TPR-like protein [Gloeophyllum trabeum ATCC 11539]EPQ55553.1 TPR-like protein [Gloeophyllum trabeum ATCC 11539]
MERATNDKAAASRVPQESAWLSSEGSSDEITGQYREYRRCGGRSNKKHSDTYDSGTSDSEPSESDEESEGDESADDQDSPVSLKDTEVTDGDFDRLVESLRQTDVGSDTSGLLTKVWDFNAEQQDAEFKDDLRAASGVGRVKKKRGRRIGPVLSQQVKSLIGDGNQAYVDNDLKESIRIMLEVIRIEPRAASAWSVLAQCHEDLGEMQKALQLRIMAAHLLHDPELWERLAAQSKQLGYNEQAIYCYRKLYTLDPTNVKALLDRAFIAKEIGDLRTARHSLLTVLKHMPHDLGVLKELRPILIETSDLSTCASLFQSAFEHYQSVFPSGHTIDPESGAPIPGGGFDMMDLFVLADLYNTSTLAQYEKAVQVIKRGCRWLQGRLQQRYWDMCEDDREYDVDPVTMPHYDFVRDGEPRPGMYPLDVNARHRLAVARIKMGDLEEGKMHANIILSEDIMDYAPLFAEIADAYFERELYAEARHIYEQLGADASAAACRRMLGDLREAAEVYHHADHVEVILADPLNNDAKMKLAEIYEVLNEPRKALDLVHQGKYSRNAGLEERSWVYRPNRPDDEQGTPAPGSSLFEEKSRGRTKTAPSKSKSGLTAAQVKALEDQKEREALRAYSRIKDLWPGMMKGDEASEREWLLEAEKLVETFRETRNLFLTTKHNPFQGMFRQRRPSKRSNEAEEDNMASRLQLELESEQLSQKTKDTRGKVNAFRGVSFDEWLQLFMQFAFLLTNRGQYTIAEEVLRHILYSNAYQEPSVKDTIRLAIIACAIRAGQFSVVVEQCRRLINIHQFNNEPFRLLCATLASGLPQTDAFIVSTLQKHILRDLKIHDTAVKNRDALKWNVVSHRWTMASAGSSKTDDGDEGVDDDAAEFVRGASITTTSSDSAKPPYPTTHNPMIVGIYGQICCAAKSYQSAICRAMQRQADNRHHLVAQGLAFLSRYRTLRTNLSPNLLDEVEFNFGRAFQQLGLHSHAARHYEHVLALSEDKRVRHEDIGIAREAAYNLSLIYATTGATPLAQALYQKWLSL